MSSQIVPVRPADTELATEHAPLTGEEARNRFAKDAFSDNTKRAYVCAINRFRKWMDAAGETEITADLLSRWIADLADKGLGISSIRQSLAAVRWAMRQQKLPDLGDDPVVRMTLRGIERNRSADDVAPKEPILQADLERMIRTLDDESSRCIYLRALLLFAWMSAMRRSELAALRWKHLRWTEQGIAVMIVRSKGDQTGQGQEIPVPYAANTTLCPVRALQRLRQRMQSLGGENDAMRPVFPLLTKTGGLRWMRASAERTLLERVRETAVAAGLNADSLGMHSFRSGFATEAARRGRDIERIQKHLRHRSTSTTARYVRRGRLFDDSVAVGIL